MIHEGTILWHDLTEDPGDLPNCYGRYLVTVMDSMRYERSMHAVPVYRIYDDYYFERGTGNWMFPDDEVTMMNYVGKDEYAHLKVIAWAEPLAPYRPSQERE